MENPNKHTIEANFYSICNDHLTRLKDLKPDKGILPEIEFYQSDLVEVYEEAKKLLTEAEMNDMLSRVRKTFSQITLEIFTNK